MKSRRIYPALRPTSMIVAVAIAASPVCSQERHSAQGINLIGGPVTPITTDVDLRDLPAVRQWRPGDPIKEVPRRFDLPEEWKNLPYQMNPDPLAGIQRAIEPRSNGGFTTPILNVPGISFTGVFPPDTVGDVGPNHYIQAVNVTSGTAFQVFDKNGSPLTPVISMNSLSGGVCSSGLGADPIVLYDRLADRWLLQELDFFDRSLCVYISQTADPVAGGWFNYELVAPEIPDYPHWGIWSDAYYITTNEDSPAVYAVDRDNMLAGNAARPMQRFVVAGLPGYDAQALTPADLDGPAGPPLGAPGLLMRHVDEEAHSNMPNDPTTDLLEIYSFEVDFDNVINSSITRLPDVVITDFNSNLS